MAVRLAGVRPPAVIISRRNNEARETWLEADCGFCTADSTVIAGTLSGCPTEN